MIPGLADWKAVMIFCSTSLDVPGWLLQKSMVFALPPPPLSCGVPGLPVPAQALEPGECGDATGCSEESSSGDLP